jgi:hypothetical protein
MVPGAVLFSILCEREKNGLPEVADINCSFNGKTNTE